MFNVILYLKINLVIIYLKKIKLYNKLNLKLNGYCCCVLFTSEYLSEYSFIILELLLSISVKFLFSTPNELSIILGSDVSKRNSLLLILKFNREVDLNTKSL